MTEDTNTTAPAATPAPTEAPKPELQVLQITGDDFERVKKLQLVLDEVQESAMEEFVATQKRLNERVAEVHKALWDEVKSLPGVKADGNYNLQREGEADGVYILKEFEPSHQLPADVQKIVDAARAAGVDVKIQQVEVQPTNEGKQNDSEQPADTTGNDTTAGIHQPSAGNGTN